MEKQSIRKSYNQKLLNLDNIKSENLGILPQSLKFLFEEI